MRTHTLGAWIPLLAILAFAGGCPAGQPTTPPGATPSPGPGATPSPGPGATPSPAPSDGATRLAACEPRFARFDADGDRRWRPTETARWLSEHPLVPTHGPCPRPGRSAPPGDRAVAQAGGAAGGTGVVEPSCPIAADAGVIAARLDRDGDGALSLAEACAFVGEQLACEARFAAHDGDRDGAVTLAEYVAANPPRPADPLSGANPAPPELVFRALDTDADGGLTPAELCGLQAVRFTIPTAADLSGAWAFGSTGEPPAGPFFGECPPGNGLQLRQVGDQVSGQELVCGGPCFVPTELAGTYRDGVLALTGVVPAPAEDAGRRFSYALRLEPRTGHLVGTRDGAPYWAAPFVRVDVEHAPCPL